MIEGIGYVVIEVSYHLSQKVYFIHSVGRDHSVKFTLSLTAKCKKSLMISDKTNLCSGLTRSSLAMNKYPSYVGRVVLK